MQADAQRRRQQRAKRSAPPRLRPGAVLRQSATAKRRKLQGHVTRIALRVYRSGLTPLPEVEAQEPLVRVSRPRVYPLRAGMRLRVVVDGQTCRARSDGPIKLPLITALGADGLQEHG